MRYFFDVHNGNELTPDEVGMELTGINEARDEAAEALAEMAGAASRDSNPRDFAIEGPRRERPAGAESRDFIRGSDGGRRPSRYSETGGCYGGDCSPRS